MSHHDDRLYLTDMADACHRVRRHLQGQTWADFQSNEMLQDAILWQLTILGEAAAKVSPPFRTAHPTVPWRDLKNLRNRLVHGYNDLDLGRVWQVAVTDVPRLVQTLDPLVAALQAEAEALLPPPASREPEASDPDAGPDAER